MNSFERIAAVVARILKVPIKDVTLSAKKEDFEKWDSLRHLNLVMAIETEFRCKFTLDEMTSVKSIKDLVDTVGKKS